MLLTILAEQPVREAELAVVLLVAAAVRGKELVAPRGLLHVFSQKNVAVSQQISFIQFSLSVPAVFLCPAGRGGRGGPCAACASLPGSWAAAHSR